MRSYAGTRDFGILDPRDPAPGVACLAGFIRRGVAARLRAAVARRSRPGRDRQAG
jgi:hypothetical protein